MSQVNPYFMHFAGSFLPGTEFSDHGNDLLADQFDGRYLVIVRYADNQVLDAGIIDGSAVFYSLAHAV